MRKMNALNAPNTGTAAGLGTMRNPTIENVLG